MQAALAGSTAKRTNVRRHRRPDRHSGIRSMFDLDLVLFPNLIRMFRAPVFQQVDAQSVSGLAASRRDGRGNTLMNRPLDNRPLFR
jgi:hypothetical protein